MKKIGITGFLSFAIVILSGCDQKTANTEAGNSRETGLNTIINKVKSELVYVKGGEFLMGDFGEQYGKEHLPYDANPDSKPLHKVELTSYSISKFKVDNTEYKFYLAYNNMSGRIIDGGARKKTRWEETNRIPNGPAHVDWYEAEAYCQWLAKVTTLPFSLPTEAQWEYAARSRGQYMIAPTDDGTIRIKDRKGINITTSLDRDNYSQDTGTSLGILSPMPGNIRPPNPLGIFDMAGNGWEWMKDWYDPDYYQKSPVKDPQGPDQPVYKDDSGYFYKTMRSQDSSGPGRGLTVTRYKADPKSRDYMPRDKTVRCVVNSPELIK
ncbi:formylglycine-generating enzyme family protein [Obesumbacterium proteus]|uniref:formylglycine-generating enzyme family protein n=1 Tax=Obesumbacterium proteus TaxID=82983 RepID=UPI001F1ABB29|nr:SUMF1/EgtB/PvdO family nonheme iron enzyme [Obesumbacterium proteus]MCE9883085.1 formylglycine-generating enzyme family protein [Obesumbacterium proteus]MCE9914727.1 formylglycine-generating enzyme family protein [Obesumbacterium proteus]MCE9929161.1 formylglycine-generating enzyme family protein [Obesumbacterium proteus]MCG2876822.1 formylglycine-generating enzyme family protein [Obesumbacterium proteus]